VSEIRTRSDESAAMAAQVLGRTLSARLRSIPSDQRGFVVERAARRAGIELLLTDPTGNVLVDAMLRTPATPWVRDLLVRGEGTTNTQLGR
jgi:hypothetical protein